MRNKQKIRPSSSCNTIWNIGAYLRLSKDDGNEKEESDSITNSKLIVESHISSLRQKGQMIGSVTYFIDDGISGTTQEERDALIKLDIAVDTGKINCVIVKDLSRLNRNVANTINDLDIKYKLKGVRFISINNPPLDSFLDPKSMDSPMITFQAMMDEMHARNTSIKVRDSFNAKRKEGLFIGAFAPYGYKKDETDKNRLLIDEEAASVVRNIYDWFLNEGLSKNGIVQKLNKLGIPNPALYKKQNGYKYKNPSMNERSTLWTARTVTAILKNEMYIGNMIQGKQQVVSFKIHKRQSMQDSDWFKKENTHEAIIDLEQFLQAQKLQEYEIRTKDYEVSIFSGLIKCGSCKRAMTRTTGSNREHKYYRCRSNTQLLKDLCPPRSISCAKLEKIVLEAIKLNLKLLESHEAVVSEIMKSPAFREKADRTKILITAREKELSALEADKDSLYFDLKKNIIDETDYIRLRKSYDEKIAKEKLALSEIKTEYENTVQKNNSINKHLENFLKHKNITALERSILVDLIDSIYIHEKGRIEINFKFTSVFNLLEDYLAQKTE